MMQATTDFSTRVWAEINLDSIIHNYNLCKSLLPERMQIIAVVKANAYGHGAIQIAHHLNSLGCTSFAVSNITEAVSLRKGNIKGTILVLGYVHWQDVGLLARYNITATVYSTEYALLLNQQATKLGYVIDTHIKIDTGMGRIGWLVDDEQVYKHILHVSMLSNLRIKGIYTHLSVADSQDSANQQFTAQQIDRFEQLVEQLLRQYGLQFEVIHCCNSAGTFCYGRHIGNAIRVGICLYGLYPNNYCLSHLPLQPSMTVKSTISYVKGIKANQYISYGRTYRSTRDMSVATVTIGYADGYNRLLSNNGQMWVNGHLAPIVGRVTMDQTMIDVTDIDCRMGDNVIIFGPPSDISMELLSRSIGTINYETACCISARVPRVFIKNNRVVDIDRYIY
ncbi:MAG: alanine racemase [Clostridia bacterium]|nr:alanine racemase [Clostridia bacterium]